MNASRLACSALLAAALAACGTKPERIAAPSSAPAASSSPAPAPTPVPTPVPTPAAGLVFVPDPGWVVEKPTSAMRKAQYRLPHAEKDAEDASLVVFFFGGQGGGLQANIDRWCQQFEQPDGRPSTEVLKTSESTANGMAVHRVELSGTYVAETSPGSGEHLRKEGWRMIAAVLDAKEGSYYAKLVGPAATVARWEESFKTFVSKAKPGA